jgi:hypothetical protein
MFNPSEFFLFLRKPQYPDIEREETHIFGNDLISIVIFFILFLLLHRLVSAYKQNLISFWNKNFIYVFYSMCLIFGLGHMGNYKYTTDIQYLIAPLLVLPQFIIGLILAFTRLYYQKGFLIAILVHVMINSISVSLYLLALRV